MWHRRCFGTRGDEEAVHVEKGHCHLEFPKVEAVIKLDGNAKES